MVDVEVDDSRRVEDGVVEADGGFLGDVSAASSNSKSRRVSFAIRGRKKREGEKMRGEREDGGRTGRLWLGW